MSNKITYDERLCLGCGRCGVYCITSHSKSKDIIKAFMLENLRGTERIALIDKELATQCRQCSDHPCVAACISGSMHVDEFGHVVNDEDKCIGCFSCVVACPNGAVRPQTGSRRFALKCDLCGDGEAACVAACPNRALIIVEGGND
jgi:carbon-monoxide dehydrogenase iron sulfur subunit